MPETSLATAEQSIGAALEEAARLGGDTGAALAAAARSAYADAMGTALLVAAAVTVVTIAFVRRSLPRRDREPAPVENIAPVDRVDAVEARGLLKRYGATTALDGIDLKVPVGSVTVVLGPNGAGKPPRFASSPPSPTPTKDTRRSPATTCGPSPPRSIAASGSTAEDATVDPLLTGRENLVMLGELHQLSRSGGTPPGGRATRRSVPHRRRRSGGVGLLGGHAPPV